MNRGLSFNVFFNFVLQHVNIFIVEFSSFYWLHLFLVPLPPSNIVPIECCNFHTVCKMIFFFLQNDFFLYLTSDGSFQQQIARPSQEEKVEEKEEDKAEKTEKKEEEKKDDEEKEEKEDSK